MGKTRLEIPLVSIVGDGNVITYLLPTNKKMVVSMIWSSYRDKLYKKNHWNDHHQHFYKKLKVDNKTVMTAPAFGLVFVSANGWAKSAK